MYVVAQVGDASHEPPFVDPTQPPSTRTSGTLTVRISRRGLTAHRLPTRDSWIFCNFLPLLMMLHFCIGECGYFQKQVGNGVMCQTSAPHCELSFCGEVLTVCALLVWFGTFPSLGLWISQKIRQKLVKRAWSWIWDEEIWFYWICKQPRSKAIRVT